MRPLCLSICLRMERSRVRQSCPQQLHESRPEHPSEPRISIADYGRRDTEVPYDAVEK